LCTGKIYYELIEERRKLAKDDVAILRVEQLYPWPLAALIEALRPYADNTPVAWVQDEPENMGAWPFVQLRAGPRFLKRFPLYGLTRPESASPATGSHASHALEEEWLLHRALEMPLARSEEN
jgi:2-oxoglutarate dehydrogenase E1 component